MERAWAACSSILPCHKLIDIAVRNGAKRSQSRIVKAIADQNGAAGGGNIDFYFNDGDIMSIEEDIDETIIHEMNEGQFLEILDALDLNESVMISYYDRIKGGVMNGTGELVEKNVAEKSFKIKLNLLNDIELDDPKTVSLNLEVDTVLDLEVVI